MNNNTKDITITAMTLEDTLREAKELGFEIAQTVAHTHSIDDLLEELEMDALESPCEYMIFRNVIVRLPGYGTRDCEIIYLD